MWIVEFSCDYFSGRESFKTEKEAQERENSLKEDGFVVNVRFADPMPTPG